MGGPAHLNAKKLGEENNHYTFKKGSAVHIQGGTKRRVNPLIFGDTPTRRVVTMVKGRVAEEDAVEKAVSRAGLMDL